MNDVAIYRESEQHCSQHTDAFIDNYLPFLITDVNEWRRPAQDPQPAFGRSMVPEE